MNRTIDQPPLERSVDPPDARLTWAVVLDTVAVVVFVAVGRRSHEQDPGLTGVFATAAPFLVGLAVGWIATRAWRRPNAVRTGLGVWVATVGLGMVLRNVVFGDGTAASFVIVAAAFTFACLIGWRLVVALAGRASRRAT